MVFNSLKSSGNIQLSKDSSSNSRYNIRGKFLVDNIGTLHIYGNYDFEGSFGEISLISSSFDLRNLSSLLSLEKNNISATVFLRGKITGNIFSKPFYNFSIHIRDLSINTLKIDRLTINLKGIDLKNLDASVSGKYSNSTFWSKGRFDLFNLKGELKGRINWNDFVKFSPYFVWQGSFSSWSFEIFSKNSSLRYNNFYFNLSDLSLKIDSENRIEGYLFYLDRGCYLYAGLNGTLDKWKLVVWGENLNILDSKLQEIGFSLSSDFVGDMKIKIGDQKVIKSEFILSFDNKVLTLKDISYNDFKLGNLEIMLSDNNKLNISGDILEGKVSGYYVFGNSGNVKFLSIKIGSLKLDGNIFIEREGLSFYIPQMDIYEISFKNVTGKIEFKDPSYIKEISIVAPYELKILGDVNIENDIIKALLKLRREEKEIGRVQGIGGLEKFEVEGLILGSNIMGYIDILKGKMNVTAKGLDLSIIDNSLKGVLEELNLIFENNILLFEGKAGRLDLNGLRLNDLAFKGKYDGVLKMDLSSIYEGFNLKLSGIFDFVNKNEFTLFVEPNLENQTLNKVLNLKFKGKLFTDLKSFRLDLVEHEIKDLFSAYFLVDLDRNLLNGKMIFRNNGIVELNSSLEGNGVLSFSNLSLEMLNNFNIENLKGIVSGNIEIVKWEPKRGSIEGKDLSYGNIPLKIESKIDIERKTYEYLIKGELKKLSKKPGIIEGTFSSDNFKFLINFDDIEAIENFVSKDLIGETEIGKGKLLLKIQGDLKTQEIIGNIKWETPIILRYLKEKIKETQFRLVFEDNKMILDDFKIYGMSNVFKARGVILPILNIEIPINNLCLVIPDLFNGYIDGDLKLIKEKDVYKIEGSIEVFNAHIYYPKTANMPKMNFYFPISLDLEMRVKDNVIFYENNFIYVSLKGSIAVRGDINRPILDGKLNFVKGNINVLGNDFIVKEGYFKFPGLSFEENIWEISAVKNIQGYNITLKGFSFMGNTSFIFTSEPFLSFREILFLLLGQKNLPIAQRETWTLATLVESIPVGVEGIISTAFGNYILAPLLSELEKIFQLDKVSIEYTFEGIIPRWRSISFEKKIFNNLFLNLSYSLEGDRLWNTELRYQFDRNLYFKLFISEQGNFSLNFEYSTQF